MFFYAAFAFSCLEMNLSGTNIGTLFGVSVLSFRRILQVSAALLYGLKILMQQYTPKQLALSALIFGIALLTTRATGDFKLLWLALFVVAGKDARFRPIAMIVLIVTGFTFVCTVSGYLAGLIPSADVMSMDGSKMRMAMGFGHPNRFGAAILVIACSYFALRFPKIRVWDIGPIAISLYTIISISGSRTAALSIAIVALVFIIGQFCLKTGKTETLLKILFCAAIITVLGALYLTAYYDPSVAWESTLNNLLTGRLRLAHYYYVNGSITLFGTDYADSNMVQFGENADTFVVDNAYARLLVRYGIVPTIILLTGYVCLFVKALKERALGACLLGFSSFVFIGFSESYVLDISTNYFLMGLSAALFSEPLRHVEHGAPRIEPSRARTPYDGIPSSSSAR